MQFETLGTGSSGNCFLINNDLLIDAGLPYSKIKEKVQNVKYVFISHIHGDHIELQHIRELIVNIDPIFICGNFLKDHILNLADNNKIKVVHAGKIYNIGRYKISPIIAIHDVECYGLRIMDEDGHKHFHITDTNTLDGIEAKNYDTASIECNHEISRALELIDEAKENGEFTHLKGAINSHLSVDKAIRFCKENRIKRLYAVHIGSSTKKEVIDALREF